MGGITCRETDCCVASEDIPMVVEPSSGLTHSEQLSARPGYDTKSQQQQRSFVDARRLEKERLKHMVRLFASNAVRGVPCSMVDLQTGRLDDAEYSIDQTLHSFSLRPIGWQPSAGTGPVTLDVGNIMEVWGIQDVPPSVHISGSLMQDERDRLAVIGYVDSQGYKRCVAILEADFAARECFTTCMNVIRLYAEVNN